MAHAASHSAHEIKNPGTFEVSSACSTAFMAFTAIGVAAFLAGLKSDSARAWASFVHNHFFFLSLGLGGLVFAAIQWVTGAMWSSPVRRLGESFTAYLPVALVMFVALYFGLHSLYPWTHAEHVRGDLVLEGKSGYLNVSFFMIRNLIAFGIWIFFAKKMIGNSLAQDASRSYALTERNRVLAPGFLILFGVSFTMASFDVLMSLDPHWFSTIFGVYCFAGMLYSVHALICLLTIALRNNGKLADIVNDNHLHDLGKFMFGFTVFWAYIGFSQFMLIWYANLPEETGYYLARFKENWMYMSAFLLIGKFVMPFFLLLPRDSKRNPKLLTIVAVWMLICQWIDVLWMVQPEFFKHGPRFGWIEIGVTLGFLGLFGLAVSRFLARNNVVAIGDPRLPEAVFHHHQ